MCFKVYIYTHFFAIANPEPMHRGGGMVRRQAGVVSPPTTFENKKDKNIRNSLTIRNNCDTMKSQKIQEERKMNVITAIREIMKIQSVGVNKLADRLGIKQNVLSMRLKQENISINKLTGILRMLDYKIVLLPRETRVPEGGFEIE